MFVVTVSFTLARGRVAVFEAAVIEQARLSREQEPGCHRFDVCRTHGTDDRIFLYEVYADAEAFEAHKATDHFATFDGVVKRWIVAKRVETHETMAT